VKGPGIGRKEFDHALVGRLVLDYVGALLPGTLDQQLVTYTAPAGSPRRRRSTASPPPGRTEWEARSKVQLGA
jgi:hypothetical protein